nr:hypothetical protein [Liquorilactobacillus satsumensis]
MKQSYRINDVLTLRVPATSDAHQLYSLIAHDQKELQRWLPWAKTTLSPADEEAFILYSLGQIQEGKLWSATCVSLILRRGQLISMKSVCKMRAGKLGTGWVKNTREKDL